MTETTRNLESGLTEPDRSQRQSAKRWRLALIAILLLAAVQQGLVLSEAWRDNPLTTTPLQDAETYWNWAGDIAHGQFMRDTPFMSAPLYPYMLGLVRALGGGLLAVYVLQGLLRLATVALLARVASKRFGAAVGVIGAALFVSLTEPAYFADRVLNCTLQVFLVVLLYHTLVRARERSTLGRWAQAGAAIGLNCLANPPMLLAIGFCAIWAWWTNGWKTRGLASAGVLAAVAVAVVSPATWHNYKVSGEFIPVSAQAGVTFAQGNNMKATGGYANIAGVSGSQQKQNLDALRLYRQSTSEQGGWSAANRFFFKRGLEFWREHTARALKLCQVKLYWFVTGCVAGEIYAPVAEVDQGFAKFLRLAPLPLAWIAAPALLILLTMARKPRRNGPELILVLIPLLIVAAFFYSPRYRFPATPILVVAAASGLWEMLHWRKDHVWSITIAVATGVSVYLTFSNERSGFDTLRDWRGFVQNAVGVVYSRTGDRDAARSHYELALKFDPEDANTRANLAAILAAQGDWAGAIEQRRAILEVMPESATAQFRLGRTLADAGRRAESLKYLREAVRLSPLNADYHSLLAGVLADSGEVAEAIAHAREAVKLAEQNGRHEAAASYRRLLAACESRRGG